MIRLLMRALISRFSIALIEFVLVIPMTLSIIEISKILGVAAERHEAMDIVTGIGVIMIGFGVVLEERLALREIFQLVGGPDEDRQTHVDHSCHHIGVGQLIFGLLAEICIEMIKIPNTIINTDGIDDALVVVGCGFVALGAVLLVRHAVMLIFFMSKHETHGDALHPAA